MPSKAKNLRRRMMARAKQLGLSGWVCPTIEQIELMIEMDEESPIEGTVTAEYRRLRIEQTRTFSPSYIRRRETS